MKFSASDLERIKAAVKESEDKISGEIVPVVVDKSGYYTIAKYRSSMCALLIMFVLIILFDRYVNPELFNLVSQFLLVGAAGIFGFVVPTLLQPLNNFMIGQRHIERATRQRAESVFLEEEVFNTRHRTGILIFVSLYEKEVLIIADRGISKVVDQKKWDKLVTELTTRVERLEIVEGLENAIRESGKLLLEYGFHKEKDDTNELGDDLRLD